MANKKGTLEQFIERAKAVHGDRYDYSKSEYISSKTKICIICPEHGEFWQQPLAHTSQGRGCPICAGKRSTQSLFIEQSKAIHGDKYDYSKVQYTNGAEKVCIICPIHGEFWQTPNAHTQGHGCSKCAREHVGSLNLKGRDAFIRQAQKKHGNKYDYSEIPENVKRGDKLPIICPIHGRFWQKGIGHLSGAGCPQCANENKTSLIAGVGINDYVGCVRGRGIYDKSYFIWSAMIRRCYCEQTRHRFPSYAGCTVADSWHLYSNFRDWYNDPKNGNREGYHLDKDILVKGNKIYSPDTCCFVPEYINVIMTHAPKKNSNLPMGVFRKRKRFGAMLHKNGIDMWLGCYDTPEEAFLAYKEAKEAHIKEVATSYYKRGEITEKVYNALMNYAV